MAKLNIVGVGPGSAEYITEAARKAVRDAQLVIGAKRSLNLFSPEIKGETVVLTANNIDAALKLAVESSQNGKNVSLLSTGDPGFAGLLKSILDRGLAKAEELNVVAGVSSIQVCAARLGMCWDDAWLISFHEGVSEAKKVELVKAVRARKDVLLLPDSKTFPPARIASYLVENGIDKKIKVYLCENLTLNNERIVACSLEEATTLEFSPLCIMVIKAKQKS